MSVQAEGPYCSISSHLQDMRIPWVRSDETDVAETFKRQVAIMRSPYYESAYDEVDRDHHMMFAEGFAK